jgi:ABC-2 type transport system ATP-binding protein
VADAIIRTEKLTKRFGDFTAVDALSIRIEAGSIFAFLGANGSGKSTTIKMLIGLLHPTSGSIAVDGVDVIRNPRRVRDRIGYMGQKVSFYQGLTIRENVEFYAGLYGLDDARLAERWGAVRERFGLADAEGSVPADLPAGIRQRAGLALSTLHRPRILFLDEPTAGVDVHSRGLFWELIQDEAASGVTVFVTTHFMEEVDYCERVSFIHEGRLLADTTPEELRAKWSVGYRVRVSVPATARARAASLLAASGVEPRPDADGLVVEAPQLVPALLDAATRATDAIPGASVHVEQTSMTDVFRRLLENAGARP